MSCIAAKSTRGIADVPIHEGNINGQIFSDFISQSLVPLLQPFDGKNSRSVVVVIMHPYIMLKKLLLLYKTQVQFSITYHHIALITIHWKNPLQKLRLS